MWRPGEIVEGSTLSITCFLSITNKVAINSSTCDLNGVSPRGLAASATGQPAQSLGF